MHPRYLVWTKDKYFIQPDESYSKKRRQASYHPRIEPVASYPTTCRTAIEVSIPGAPGAKLKSGFSFKLQVFITIQPEHKFNSHLQSSSNCKPAT
ncbi:hypothetical protein TWF192_001989 [Orbilia oligospora]|uniref:Uncharacterized protein n=1 Tax=Orbilia oligospora TaxID=2813651 RepID=A0A6G1LTH9_ORBOL|nr:hypothetical protein TWF679_007740 [Orbilia oligospora]KAF3233798.1 hypothetical protein TWF192_001989 [Orbilia oligospora]